MTNIFRNTRARIRISTARLSEQYCMALFRAQLANGTICHSPEYPLAILTIFRRHTIKCRLPRSRAVMLRATRLRLKVEAPHPTSQALVARTFQRYSLFDGDTTIDAVNSGIWGLGCCFPYGIPASRRVTTSQSPRIASHTLRGPTKAVAGPSAPAENEGPAQRGEGKKNRW